MSMLKYYFLDDLTEHGKKILDDSIQLIQSFFANNKKIGDPNSSNVGIVIQVRNQNTIAQSILTRAWVYWLDGNSLTTLRTNNHGRLFARLTGRERKNPWEYTEIFIPNIGSNVRIFFSRGAKPIPNTELISNPSVFQQRTVALEIILSDVVVELTKPDELSIWPLLWELPVDNSANQNLPNRPDYLTAGLSQGLTLWGAQNNLTLTQNETSPLAPNEVTSNGQTIRVRPRERGLLVEGKIDSSSTGVRLKILKDDGQTVTLREGIDPASATRNEITCSISTMSDNNKRTFQAHVFFANSVEVLGPVQIIITSEGISPPMIGAFSVHLSGFQISLVDDHTQNPNGQMRGPILREPDEKIIIDFVNSPQPTLDDLRAQTRARRMISYSLANESRALDAAQPIGENNPAVIEPQMPLWMVELQIVGMTTQQLEDLMSQRYFVQNIDFTRAHDFPITMRFEIRWNLRLFWDGPDTNSPQFPNLPRHNQTYRYSEQFPRLLETQVVRMHFGSRGQFVDANNQDVQLDADAVSSALEPAPQQIPFPTQNRRLPKVIVRNQMRHWGRHTNAIQRNSLVMEFQPRITNEQNGEIIRGGNGILELQTIVVNGKRIDSGLVLNQENNLISSPGNEPLIRLPTFRVKGLNPVQAIQIDVLIDRLVENYYNRHNNLARIQLLSLACWQETMRRIIQHESGGLLNGEYRGGQFSRRLATNIPYRHNDTVYHYGNQLDMPNFGPPHGFGLGQLDFIFGRGTNSNEVWSFFHNIESAINLLMGEKATGAYSLLSAHLPEPLDQRIRATYQREIVRRYNGGTEFVWNNDQNTWEIHPTLQQWENPNNHVQGANRALRYPNLILDTNVVYSNGNGANTVFPWPITFTANDYGPLTQ